VDKTAPVYLENGKMIRVAIVEDQQDIRESLAVLINGTPGYRLTAAYSSMEDALARLDSDLPDVVLVDLGLPGMSGIKGIRKLKDRHPPLPVVVLTVYDDDDRVFDAVCAGACGYLLKTTTPARLLESVKEVLSGGAPMSPEVARKVLELFRARSRPAQPEAHHLTPHEVRVLKLLVEGHTLRTAAAELGVTVHGIAFHLRRIYEKLQVTSKSQAIAKVLRNKIIT
jgi:DNA-binding NarL/FixJ family response regulator